MIRKLLTITLVITSCLFLLTSIYINKSNTNHHTLTSSNGKTAMTIVYDDNNNYKIYSTTCNDDEFINTILAEGTLSNEQIYTLNKTLSVYNTHKNNSSFITDYKYTMTNINADNWLTQLNTFINTWSTKNGTYI